MTRVPKIAYCNTDLALVAAFPLDQLVAALALRGVSTFGVTKTEQAEGGTRPLSYANFNTDEQYDDLEQNVVALLAAVESLDRDERTAWRNCVRREFNVGYDCGDEPWAFNQGLSEQTIARLAAASAELRITLYPSRDVGNP